MASDTAHCGQKQIRRAPDFCRGFTPTVCANMYTATDLCPVSISRLQRRQTTGCIGYILAFVFPCKLTFSHAIAIGKYEERFLID
jgi:hypothetical protein